MTIANKNAPAKPWNGGIADWVSRTINLESVSHTVATGRSSRLRLVVANGSGDDMWFACDTTSYASTLQVG